MKPNTPIPVSTGGTATPVHAARQVAFTSKSRPGRWRRITRRYRDGHIQTWWAAELTLGRYGPGRAHRLIVASSDPQTLPATSTWYLATNLPRRRHRDGHQPADLNELVRLYGLRGWIEQDYKQVKHELGWAHFQVRSGRAIRRHWTLVNIAFCFAWLQPDPTPTSADDPPTAAVHTPRPHLGTWPERLRQIRAYLTPLRDLQRLARAGVMSLLIPETAALLAYLNQGNGISLYLPT